MGGRTLDQFNSRQQARAKKSSRGKDDNAREQEELDTAQTNQSQTKNKY
jgi:hypothetical protein